MSAYYLKQVVKDWSLATIYGGMFQFMILQVICIGLLVAFPQIALWFPETPAGSGARRRRFPRSTRRSSTSSARTPSRWKMTIGDRRPRRNSLALQRLVHAPRRPRAAGCNRPPQHPIIRAGGWRRTCPSPTGSGPEGSSPNEPDAGRLPASHYAVMPASCRRRASGTKVGTDDTNPCRYRPMQAPAAAGVVYCKSSIACGPVTWIPPARDDVAGMAKKKTTG